MSCHKCAIDDQIIVAQRANPLDPSWSEWTLVVCSRCKAIAEWQHHSQEQTHGGDLEISATPTVDYLRHIYGLAKTDIEQILVRRRKARIYNRYTGVVEERDAW